jgi:hypothetical protein
VLRRLCARSPQYFRGCTRTPRSAQRCAAFLHQAAWHGASDDVAAELIRLGALRTLTDSHGRTPYRVRVDRDLDGYDESRSATEQDACAAQPAQTDAVVADARADQCSRQTPRRVHRRSPAWDVPRGATPPQRIQHVPVARSPPFVSLSALLHPPHSPWARAAPGV